jgi:hypothetical protein
MYFATILAAAWLLLVTATPAYAYLDPGSGGMIVQLLLGGLAGAGVLVRLFWNRVRKLVGLEKPDDEMP